MQSSFSTKQLWFMGIDIYSVVKYKNCIWHNWAHGTKILRPVVYAKVPCKGTRFDAPHLLSNPGVLQTVL